jgi:hypothetical protein
MNEDYEPDALPDFKPRLPLFRSIHPTKHFRHVLVTPEEREQKDLPGCTHMRTITKVTN